MSSTEQRIRIDELGWGTLLLFSGLAAYIIYAQGFGGLWTFDDARVLEGLRLVEDWPSAVAFMFHDAEVGPLHRPLAMASFLLNIDDWPSHPHRFRHINVLIHILNGLLVALIALRVARQVPRLAGNASGFAAALAMVWMLHPLLASTSMMVVQRMTLLAGTFSLLGILAYLHGRERLAGHPASAYAWMSAGLAGATLLGMLAKESAALTPVLTGVLELVVLSRHAPVGQRHFARWKKVFFGLPLLGIAAYMAYYLATRAGVAYQARPFTLSERLWSEAVILFEYLRQILLPDVAALGPFQDDTARIVGPTAASLAAALAWAALIVSAVLLRRRLTALAFAVLFYLAGHLLESTLFPLELYFEHRNYLACLGPLGALVALLAASEVRWARLLPIPFAGLMAYSLWQAASLWADPLASARQWLDAHPTSTRAVQNWATQHQIRGRYHEAAGIIVDNYHRKPRDGGLALMAVIAQCFGEPAPAGAALLADVARDAPGFFNALGAPLALHRLLDLRLMNRCPAFDADGTLAIAHGLLENPAFAGYRTGRYDLQMVMARAYDLAGDPGRATDARVAAFRAEPHRDALEGAVEGLLAAGRAAEARDLLEEARRRLPERASWLREPIEASPK